MENRYTDFYIAELENGLEYWCYDWELGDDVQLTKEQAIELMFINKDGGCNIPQEQIDVYANGWEG